MVILGTLIVVAFFIGSAAMSGPLGIFIDIPSMLLVIGPVIGAIIARHGLKGFKQIFDLENSEQVYKTVGITALTSGILGSVMGMVIMLQNLSDPAAIGPAMAISLLTGCYGLAVFILSYVLCKKIEWNASVTILPFFILGFSASSLFIVLLSFSKLI